MGGALFDKQNKLKQSAGGITVNTSQLNITAMKPPVFYDVTLRDGNQALARPMTVKQKLEVFNWLVALGVKHIEVGYPNASDMDFQACRAIAEQAPSGMIISVLARCHRLDIDCAVRALANVSQATPRLHTFIGMSQFHMAHILGKTPEEVKDMAIIGIKRAKTMLEATGKQAQIQFSPEHFGDCLVNLEWVISALKEIVAAGADVINLPNTVERTRPAIFAGMVRKVVEALPSNTIIAVHCHNDLGMATATTIESYFEGARQLEVTLNSLGERAGNTNLYETAVALHLAGVPVGLDLSRIYDTALRLSELIGVPISQNAPIIGQESFYHRSGVHQHGAVRTFERAKKAYLPFDPVLVGRAGDEELRFTSQSGYAAVLAIVKEAGHLIIEQEARELVPALKEVASGKGELTPEEVVAVYEQYQALKISKTQVGSEDLAALVGDITRDRGQQIWQRVFTRAVAGDHPTATISLRRNGEAITRAALGDGPVDAAFEAIRQITGIPAKIEKYRIDNVTSGGDSLGKVVCCLMHDGRCCEGSSTGTDIVIASVDAYLDALNQLLVGESNGKKP